MVIVLIVLLLVISFIESKFRSIRWVFINYHKSGTVFSENLVRGISTLTNCGVKTLRGHRTEDFNNTSFQEECGDICTIHAPNLNFDWSIVFRCIYIIEIAIPIVKSFYFVCKFIETLSDFYYFKFLLSTAMINTYGA